MPDVSLPPQSMGCVDGLPPASVCSRTGGGPGEPPAQVPLRLAGEDRVS
jgi:hypothetical protein